ncbi:MAG: ferrous iron transport protein A [Clostridiales Family XIII bacterium]|nr:ferrous iron transport protein A [Clostridiales Family XIII bacterium]
MPLSMTDIGGEFFVKKVGGNEEMRKFLGTLGFVAGSSVSVVSKTGENVIVRVKDSRIAISREMARKIMV